MKKTLLLVLVTLITVGSYAQKKPKIKGDKNVIDITENIDDPFNAVEIDDGLEVDLLPAAKPFYRLQTDENLSRILQFKVEDSVLRIYTEYKIVSKRKLKIELSASGIDAITLKNDAKIESKNRLESNKMVLTANESSRFDLDIAADSIAVLLSQNAGGKLNLVSKISEIKMSKRSDLKMRTSSDSTMISLQENAELDIDGNTEKAAFILSGGSSVKAKKFRVISGDINISDRANATLFVGKDLGVYAKDKSKIELYGEPKIDMKGLLNDAEIEKKD